MVGIPGKGNIPEAGNTAGITGAGWGGTGQGRSSLVSHSAGPCGASLPVVPMCPAGNGVRQTLPLPLQWLPAGLWAGKMQPGRDLLPLAPLFFLF